MKTKLVSVPLMLSILFFGLTSFKVQPDLYKKGTVQELISTDGVYDGKEDYGYNFIIVDEEGETRTLTFQSVEKSILEVFDLNSEALVNAEFKISYTITIIKTIDEDGNEDEEEINTLVKLEKL